MSILDRLNPFKKDPEPENKDFLHDPITDGVQDIDKVITICDSVLALGLALEDAGHDGWTVGDGFALVKPTYRTARTLKHFKEAGEEMKDLRVSEMERLKQRYMDMLQGSNIHNAKVLNLVRALLIAGPGLVELLEAIKILRSDEQVMRAKIAPDQDAFIPDDSGPNPEAFTPDADYAEVNRLRAEIARLQAEKGALAQPAPPPAPVELPPSLRDAKPKHAIDLGDCGEA